MASEKVEQLLAEYQAADKETKAMYEALRVASLDEFFLKTGDKVRVHVKKGTWERQQVVEKIGIVKSIEFSIDHFGKAPKVQLKPVVLPLKKDGTMAQIGEIYIWTDTKIELVSRPE